MTHHTATVDEELTTRVRAALHRQFGSMMAAVDDDRELRDVLGDRYDSLAVMECVSRIEREFGVEVDFMEHDVRYHFSSVGLICRYLADQLEDQRTLSV